MNRELLRLNLLYSRNISVQRIGELEPPYPLNAVTVISESDTLETKTDHSIEMERVQKMQEELFKNPNFKQTNPPNFEYEFGAPKLIDDLLSGKISKFMQNSNNWVNLFQTQKKKD